MLDGKKYSEQDLVDIAVDLIKSLKPMALTIGEIRKVAEHMAKETEYITYGP